MQSSKVPAPPAIFTSPMYYPSTAMEDRSHLVEKKASSSSRVLSLSILQNVTQLLIGGVIICALILPLGIERGPLSQHIILCTVGYFLLILQALLSFSPVGWANYMTHENQRFIYSLMQILGSIMAITGCSIPFFYHNDPLFENSHKICGFVAMLLTILNLIGGVATLMVQRQTNAMKIVHMSLATVTVAMAFIAVILAFHIYYRVGSDDRLADLSIILCVLALKGVLILSCFKIFKRLSK